jgi:hypothetical protein
MIEHRWNTRLEADIDVLLVTREACSIAGKVRNLSLHGMYVEAAAPLAQASYVKVQLRLPTTIDRTPVELCAMVVHRNGSGLGLMVDMRDERTVELMQTLLTQCSNPPRSGPRQKLNRRIVG